jgi:hypothetical protein
MRYLILVTLLLIAVAVPTFAASSFFGSFSGDIVTPDTSIEPTGSAEASFHDALNVLGGGGDLKTYGLMYGVVNKLEAGVSFVSTHTTDAAFSGKYRILDETPSMPSIAVGIFDAFGSVSVLGGNPAVYIAASKNITPLASDIVGSPSKPLILTLGGGTGEFDGFFASLNWTFEPRLSLIGEFYSGQIKNDYNNVNAGLRYAITDTVRIDAATLAFKEFAFGASIRFRF